MTLDELLRAIREGRLILINECECWPSPPYTGAIKTCHAQALQEVALAYSHKLYRDMPITGSAPQVFGAIAKADLNAKCAERYTLHMLYKQNMSYE